MDKAGRGIKKPLLSGVRLGFNVYKKISPYLPAKAQSEIVLAGLLALGLTYPIPSRLGESVVEDELPITVAGQLPV